jgi:uncharacterized protein YaeQ
MMVRLAALAFNAHQLQTVCNGDGTLAFGAGLSDPDDPTCPARLHGPTRVWIEVGQPEDKPLIKACGKADQVMVYCFNHAAEVWWRGIENKLSRPQNLQVWRIPTEASQALAQLAQRSMQLQATVQEGVLMLLLCAHAAGDSVPQTGRRGLAGMDRRQAAGARPGR